MTNTDPVDGNIPTPEFTPITPPPVEPIEPAQLYTQFDEVEIIDYKYDEDSSFAELIAYVDSTYDQHYALANDLQVFDIWEATESLETTARDTAIKYLMRYGKKNGRNRNDLLKAVHYILLMMYVGNTIEDQPSEGDDR